MFTCRVCGKSDLLATEIKWERRGGHRCLECVKKRVDELNELNPARKLRIQMNARISQFKRRYGITIEQYDEMFQEQGGVCAICQQECSTHQNLSIDHDHETGKVRGLLCLRCNHTIGRAGEDVELLLKMIDYVMKHRKPELKLVSSQET
jgi:hypothetical protein